MNAMERITDIRTVTDVQQATLGVGGGMTNLLGALSGSSEYDGYAVTTTEQTIYVLIDNGQSCCESFGYLASADDLAAFIGAELREMVIVDTALNTHLLSQLPDLDDGGAVFVNFVTDRGVLQLACYNAHNGYYGHEVHILSRQIRQAIGI